MNKKVIDRAQMQKQYSAVVSKGNDVIAVVKQLREEFNLPFSMDWYRQHASDRKQLELWYAGQFEREKKESGVTELTEEGKQQIEATRIAYANSYEQADKLLSKIRPSLNDGVIEWQDTDKGISFSEDQVKKYAMKNNTFAIDDKSAAEYYSILADVKALQAKMLQFEKSHKLSTLADNKSVVLYTPYEFSGAIVSRFSLKSLLDVELTEDLFENVFANEFKQ
jgi:hypothetical protein